MAAAHANSAVAHGNGVTSLSTTGFASTTGSTFTMGVHDPASISSTSDNKGNGSYGAALASISSGSATLSVRAKENGAGGAGHTGTVNFGSNADGSLIFTEWSGVAAASVDSGSIASTLDTSPASISITAAGALAQANNVVGCWLATGASGTVTYTDSGSGFTVNAAETDGNTYWTQSVASKVVSATTAPTATFTGTTGGTNVALIIIAFKEGSGGGGGGVGNKSHVDGIALSGISAIDGVSKAGLSAITRVASGWKRHLDGRLLVPTWPSLCKA